MIEVTKRDIVNILKELNFQTERNPCVDIHSVAQVIIGKYDKLTLYIYPTGSRYIICSSMIISKSPIKIKRDTRSLYPKHNVKVREMGEHWNTDEKRYDFHSAVLRTAGIEAVKDSISAIKYNFPMV